MTAEMQERLLSDLETIYGELFATISFAYNDTSVQPQTQAMGTATGEPSGGETPMMKFYQFQFMKSPFMFGE